MKQMQFSKPFTFCFSIRNCLKFTVINEFSKKNHTAICSSRLQRCSHIIELHQISKCRTVCYLRALKQSQSTASIDRLHLLFHYTQHTGKTSHFNTYEITRITFFYLCRMFSTSKEWCLYRMLGNLGVIGKI